MSAFYNEIDPKAAAVLRELIRRDVIAPGVVDERDIRDIRPVELDGFAQCHFFAGFGVWSYALRQAGIPDDFPCWTGSCPCQPFSAAGKGLGFADERHLWPAFFHLIRVARPGVVYGEQVASKDGLTWLDTVQADMEAAAYTVASIDICSAGFGASDIRQRLYWVADTENCNWRSGERRAQAGIGKAGERRWGFAGSGAVGGMADDNGGISIDGYLQRGGQHGLITQDGGADEGHRFPGPTNGFWRAADWLRCRDGKWRPVEPGTFPLATRATARVGRLRGYGNCINAEVAANFIRAYLEARGLAEYGSGK